MWPNLNINFPTEKNVQERILCGAGKGGGGGDGGSSEAWIRVKKFGRARLSTDFLINNFM